MTIMRRAFALALAALLLAIPVSIGQAQTTGAYYFWWQVTDERGEPYTGQNVQCSVFGPNQHAAAILHTSSQLSSGGNSPLFSDVNGKVHFYATSNAPVDVTCYYAHGGSAYVNRLDTFTHKMVVPRQQFDKVSRFSINNTSSATNQSSGITLPAGALVRDVIIQNLNPRGLGSYHVSVGFGGNHAVAANVNALVDAQALNSPDEWLRPHVIGAVGTSLGNYGVVASGNHRGVALSQFHASVCSGGVCGGPTVYREVPYLIHVASGLDVTYAININSSAGARVHVYILWQQLHTGINRLGLTN